MINVFVSVPDAGTDELLVHQVRDAVMNWGARVNSFDSSRSTLYHERSWDVLASSDLIVGIATPTSSNVFFDLGFAVGRGIPIILICNSHVVVPSNLSDISIILTPDVPDFTRSFLRALDILNGICVYRGDVSQMHWRRHLIPLRDGGESESTVRYRVDSESSLRYRGESETNIRYRGGADANTRYRGDYMDYWLGSSLSAHRASLLGNLAELAEAWFRQQGAEVKKPSTMRDPGYDFLVENYKTFRTGVVQVKSYSGSKVSVGQIQQLAEIVEALAADGGVFVTDAEFTSSAKDLALSFGNIELLTAEQLRSNEPVTPSSTG